ncbi:MAG: hypothetical protein ABH891_04670 [Candidatus Omnitrophota bacterium]
MIHDRFKKVLVAKKSLLLTAALSFVLSQAVLPGFAVTTQPETGIQAGWDQPQTDTLAQKNSVAETAPVPPAIRIPPAILDFLATGALSAPSAGAETQTLKAPETPEFVPPPDVAPPPGTVSMSTLTLGGTKAPGQSLWISSNGGRSYTLFVAESTETPWSASVDLVDGTNDFRIVAADETLNPSAEVIVPTITYSYTVPAPTVTPPGTVSNHPWIVLNGTKAAEESIRISSNGGRFYTQLVPKTTATTWSAPVKLVSGTNHFTILAQDRAGHPSAVVTIPPITYMMTAPLVTPPLATVTTRTVTLSGSKAPGASIWISSDGGLSYTPLVTNDSSVTWSVLVGLVRGDNHFTVLAEDLAGNSSAPVSVPVIRCISATPPPGSQEILFLQGPMLVPAGTDQNMWQSPLGGQT